MSCKQWPEVKLDDHVDLLSGFAFKSKDFTDNPEDAPLVKGANVHQGFIDWKGAVRWPKVQFAEFEKYQLKENDVVLAMDRPWIEAGLKYSWIKKGDPKSLLVQRVSRLRGRNGLNTRFLRYIIGSPQFTAYIKPIVTGVNVPHISGGQIKGYTFTLPPEKHQETVADILEAYDNLIENNNRRIAILEEMAQSLYHEWFVKFHFPGHENTKFIDSKLGKMPEGWEVKNLKDVCHLTMGQSPKSEFYNENEDGLPFFQGVKDFGKRFPTVRIWCSKPTRFAKVGDVLFSVRAPVGRINIADQDMAIGRGLCAILHKNKMQSFLLQQLKSIFTSEDMIGNGAIFASVTKKDMEDIKLITPKDKHVIKFCENADSIFEQLNNLSKKNVLLESQRDLLLPKLISGTITV